MRCPCSSLAKLLHSDKVRTRWDGTPEGYWPCHTEVPQIDEQVLRFRRAEEGSCDEQVYVNFCQCHSKSGTISHLHREVERLQDNESFCIGDEAMQLDMVKRPDEEEEDLDSAQVDE